MIVFTSSPPAVPVSAVVAVDGPGGGAFPVYAAPRTASVMVDMLRMDRAKARMYYVKKGADRGEIDTREFQTLAVREAIAAAKQVKEPTSPVSLPKPY